MSAENVSAENVESSAGSISEEGKDTSVNYSQARERQITSTLTIRIYGIPFADNGHVEGHMSMMFCGFQAEGNEYRECSTRIWHIPENKILASGAVKGFSCDGDPVHFFEVPKDICAVEEQYVSVSLAMLVRDAIAAQRAVSVPPSSVFAARVGEVLGSTDVSMAPIIALQRPIGGIGPFRPGLGLEGGGTYHTTWVWTKEVNNSRYDPMADDGEASLNFW